MTGEKTVTFFSIIIQSLSALIFIKKNKGPHTHTHTLQPPKEILFILVFMHREIMDSLRVQTSQNFFFLWDMNESMK